MQVGDRVVVRDAFNRLKPAIVAPVPGNWRDSSMSAVVTCRGAFRKVWVKFPDSGHVAPWPLDDVFTDLALAQTRARQSECSPDQHSRYAARNEGG